MIIFSWERHFWVNLAPLSPASFTLGLNIFEMTHSPTLFATVLLQVGYESKSSKKIGFLITYYATFIDTSMYMLFGFSTALFWSS